MVISNVIEDGKPIGQLGAYEAIWHTDMSYVDEPPSASALYSLEAPPRAAIPASAICIWPTRRCPPSCGGRSRAGLPPRCQPQQRRRIAARFYRCPRPDPDRRRRAPDRPHPPGDRQKGAVPGRRRNAYVVGLPLDESEALLDALWEHCTKPEFAWYQQWRAGDLILWDNRCVMHRRDAFDPATRRVMHRTQIKGDRPF